MKFNFSHRGADFKDLFDEKTDVRVVNHYCNSGYYWRGYGPHHPERWREDAADHILRQHVCKESDDGRTNAQAATA